MAHEQGDTRHLEPNLRARAAPEDATASLSRLAAADGAAELAATDPQQAGRVVGQLPASVAGEALAHMEAASAASIIERLPPPQASAVLAAMRPDDRVDVLERLDAARRSALIGAMSGDDVDEVRRLEKYPGDTAGGIMTTEVAAVAVTLNVGQAVAEVRRLSRELEHLYYVYVTAEDARLVGVLSMRDLLLSDGAQSVSEIMHRQVVSIADDTDQEQVARLMQKYGYVALPVVNAAATLVGVVTIDDVVDVLDEEATEDIQKIGGTLALDAPYLSVGFLDMLKKRGGWLSVLFLGEMLTATAMGFFEHQIARAVVLVLFVPLIISSGGNAGSQAATLVIRSLALGELRVANWLRVLGRELQSGLALGLWLGGIGFLRIVLWQRSGWMDYGQHYLRLGATVWFSLVGVILFGTLAGSMLPLLIRRIGFDPATSSAPFVATLVDVTGLVIYFMIASHVLSGTML